MIASNEKLLIPIKSTDSNWVKSFDAKILKHNTFFLDYTHTKVLTSQYSRGVYCCTFSIPPLLLVGLFSPHPGVNGFYFFPQSRCVCVKFALYACLWMIDKFCPIIFYFCCGGLYYSAIYSCSSLYKSLLVGEKAEALWTDRLTHTLIESLCLRLSRILSRSNDSNKLNDKWCRSCLSMLFCFYWKVYFKRCTT